MITVTLLHPKANQDTVGFLPFMLSESNPTPAREQFDAGYQHGGGWQPFSGFEMREDYCIVYPGDPPHVPLAEIILRHERILIYDHSWVAIIQPDGTYEIARMD